MARRPRAVPGLSLREGARRQAEGRLSTTVEAVRPAEPCCPWGAAKTAATVSGCRAPPPPRSWEMSQECQGSTHSTYFHVRAFRGGPFVRGSAPSLHPCETCKTRCLDPVQSATAMAPNHICSGSGNYNPVLGECICAIGFNGSSCEHNALPACRALPESRALSCPVGRPQHCECHAQCIANGAFEAHMYRFCFRGGGDALSAVPAAGEEAASFFERRDSQWVSVGPAPNESCLLRAEICMPIPLKPEGRSIRCMYSLGAALRGAAPRVPSGAGARAGRPMPRPVRRARRLSRQGRRPGRARLLQV